MSLRRGLWLFNNSLCLLLNHSIEFIVQKTQLLPTLVIRIYIALHSFLTFSSFICGTVFSSFNLFFWLSIVITSIGVQQPHKLCWLLVHVLFIGSNVTSWIKCIEFGLAKLCFQLQIKKFRKFVLFMSWCGFLTNNNKTSNKKCDTKICWVCMSCVCFFLFWKNEGRRLWRPHSPQAHKWLQNRKWENAVGNANGAVEMFAS